MLLLRQTFADRLVRARPGDRWVYHIGSLMYDRQEGPECKAVHAQAKAAWEAYTVGLVTLVQRKTAPLEFQYIAIKRHPADVAKHRKVTGC